MIFVGMVQQDCYENLWQESKFALVTINVTFASVAIIGEDSVSRKSVDNRTEDLKTN